MITVQEFMNCYAAAKSGLPICRKTRHRGYIEDYYDHEEVDFLNLEMSEVLKPDTEDESHEYYVKNW